MATCSDGAVTAGRVLSQGDRASGRSEPFDDTGSHESELSVRVSTYRYCQTCGCKIPWSGVAYRLERIEGSKVEARTLCAVCLRASLK